MTSGHIDLDAVIADANEVGLDKELARRGLREFVPIAWPLVEPSRDYIQNWHTDAICDHLEAAFKREITRLVINVPPGSMKSLSACVFFPAWVWTQRAGEKFIFASYSDKLSRRDSIRTRRLVESPWYLERWGEEVKLHQDEKNAGKIVNEAGGFRMMTTIKGGVTGEHADIQVVDDPTKPLDVGRSMHVADTALGEVSTWWNETMATRLVDFKTSVRIVIMQRLSDADLAGEAVEHGYEHLMLPMEYEPKRKCYTSIGFEDPRTDEDQLLCPERFDRGAVDALKVELGSRGAAAQLQQDPVAAGGNIIKREWFRFYEHLPRFSMMIQSWDCTFKDTDGTDYVAGQIWGVVKDQYYLVDQIRDRLSFTATCSAIKSLAGQYPKARYKIIEDKANGPAVIDHLKADVAGLKAVNPEGGKVARVHAIEPLWESGNVFIPNPESAPWVQDFIEECVKFPTAKHDDQVDAMSQALIFLHNKRAGRLRAAMANMR